MKASYFLEDILLPSSIGFASRICCSIQECLPLMAARYCRINFVLSVLPAPLSPLKRTLIINYQTYRRNIESVKRIIIERIILPNNDALILSISIHVGVAVIPDGKYVRWQFTDFTILIELYLFCSVDR